MPSRIIREGILTSEAINNLSYEAEVFYRRLHSVVDDYGRFFANPQLLRAHCYPLRLDTVTDKMIKQWVSECEKASLIQVYEQDGKGYLQVEKFDQQIRQKRMKFPEPDSKMHGSRMARV